MLATSSVLVAIVAFFGVVSDAHGSHGKHDRKNLKRTVSLPYDRRATTPALNPLPEHNTVPNGDGPRTFHIAEPFSPIIIDRNPVIYYNGSGPVPNYQQLSPVPQPITPLKSESELQNAFLTEINAIYANGSYYNTSCSQCMATTEILHLAAVTLPVETFTNLLIDFCMHSRFQQISKHQTNLLLARCCFWRCLPVCAQLLC